MNGTTFTLRIIVAFIGVAMIMLAAELHRTGNDIGAGAVVAIAGAIALESFLFGRGGYRPGSKIK